MDSLNVTIQPWYYDDWFINIVCLVLAFLLPWIFTSSRNWLISKFQILYWKFKHVRLKYKWHSTARFNNSISSALNLPDLFESTHSYITRHIFDHFNNGVTVAPTKLLATSFENFVLRGRTLNLTQIAIQAVQNEILNWWVNDAAINLSRTFPNIWITLNLETPQRIEHMLENESFKEFLYYLKMGSIISSTASIDNLRNFLMTEYSSKNAKYLSKYLEWIHLTTNEVVEIESNKSTINADHISLIKKATQELHIERYIFTNSHILDQKIDLNGFIKPIAEILHELEVDFLPTNSSSYKYHWIDVARIDNRLLHQENRKEDFALFSSSNNINNNISVVQFSNEDDFLCKLADYPHTAPGEEVLFIYISSDRNLIKQKAQIIAELSRLNRGKYATFRALENAKI